MYETNLRSSAQKFKVHPVCFVKHRHQILILYFDAVEASSMRREGQNQLTRILGQRFLCTAGPIIPSTVLYVLISRSVFVKIVSCMRKSIGSVLGVLF